MNYLTRMGLLIIVATVLMIVVRTAYGLTATILVAMACIICGLFMSWANYIDRTRNHPDKWPPG